MKKPMKLFLLLSVGLLPVITLGQTSVQQPAVVSKAVYADVSPPLREMKMISPQRSAGGPAKEVPNKIGMKEFNRLATFPFLLQEDPVWQKQDGSRMPSFTGIQQNFEGIGNLSNLYPPDTQGDVSSSYYVQVVNSNFAVYSRTGSILLGPATLSTIWAGIPAPWNGTNSGDPVVLYDQAANRWLISQFSLVTGHYAELIAISQTADPTGAWYRYVFDFGIYIPDYPKFGIWPDAYYMSINRFTASGSTWYWKGVGACAFERSKMLTGDASARMVSFYLSETADPMNMLPSDWDGAVPPIANEPNYFTYFNDWSSPTEDYLKIWAFHVDWETTANSTFSQVHSIVTAPFDADICIINRGRCIPQPGTAIKLEALSDRLMYRLQYRNFGTHRSMVTNHTVDVDGNGHAGIRWYELRNTGGGWGIHQQGTYAPDAAHRWIGSLAMNDVGDMALGYSVSDGISIYPGIRFTGRRAGDAPGQMTINEQTIMAGSGSQTGTLCRWGDYSMMSIDPVDDMTFWYTSEYIQTSGTASWQTRIASLKIDTRPDVITSAATDIATTAATLNGTVNSNGLATNFYFQWGTTTTYGNLTATMQAGTGMTPVPVSAGITGLSTGVTCHFRLVAVNSRGTTYGKDVIFTPGAAVVTTKEITSVLLTTASTGGTVIHDGGAAVTSRGVCWGTTINPVVSGNHTLDGSGTGVFTSTISGLSPSTLYHVRAYATNSTGTFYGDDFSFTTLCGLGTLPVSEYFPTATWPACWTQQVTGTGAANTWTVSNTKYSGGNYREMKSTFKTINPGTTRLVTKPFNTVGMARLNLSFRYMLDAFTGGPTLLIQSSVNGITWTNEAWSVLTTYTNINATIVNTTIVNNLDNESTFIAFTITGNLAGYDYWYIDDVQITGMPFNRQLSNITILNGTVNCYNAAQTVTVAGSGTSFTVQSGGSATMIAGQKILYLPNTTVQSGGYMWGYIAPAGPFCVTQSMPLLTSTQDELPGTILRSFFKIYPNPTSGTFMLEWTTDFPSDGTTAEIFGIRGEKVLTTRLTGERKQEFSLAGCPAGVYIIRVVSLTSTETALIVKQ